MTSELKKKIKTFQKQQVKKFEKKNEKKNNSENMLNPSPHYIGWFLCGT